MAEEFYEFCKKSDIPMWLFKLLPPGMQKDIIKRYYELYESEGKE